MNGSPSAYGLWSLVLINSLVFIIKEWNRDPVCGKRVNRNKAHIAIEYKGREFLLCCPVCQAEFERDPEKYLR